MTSSIDQRLDRCLSASGEGRFTLRLDPAFQGLPDTAHGGSVLAVFDRLSGVAGPREVLGVYRRRVPPATPLILERRRPGDGVAFELRDNRSILVEGHVVLAADDGRAGATARPERHALPVSRACFACGIDNSIGLRLALGFDEETVGGEWMPRAPFRRSDGRVTTAALTTLLDEAAFWLGALATGESGMTTEIRVRLHRPASFGTRLVVAGRRADVTPREDDPRYWLTLTAVRDADGALIASGRITFVAVRGAAKRLAAGMLAMNPPDVVRRVFPAHA